MNKTEGNILVAFILCSVFVLLILFKVFVETKFAKSSAKFLYELEHEW